MSRYRQKSNRYTYLPVGAVIKSSLLTTILYLGFYLHNMLEHRNVIPIALYFESSAISNT